MYRTILTAVVGLVFGVGVAGQSPEKPVVLKAEALAAFGDDRGEIRVKSKEFRAWADEHNGKLVTIPGRVYYAAEAELHWLVKDGEKKAKYLVKVYKDGVQDKLVTHKIRPDTEASPQTMAWKGTVTGRVVWQADKDALWIADATPNVERGFLDEKKEARRLQHKKELEEKYRREDEERKRAEELKKKRGKG